MHSQAAAAAWAAHLGLVIREEESLHPFLLFKFPCLGLRYV